MTFKVFTEAGTIRLMPIEDGKKARREAGGSGALASSVPSVSGVRAKVSSSAVSSTRWASEASRGTRNPVRYQREGAVSSTSASRSEPLAGPIRSSLRASTRRFRTSTGFTGRPR